ncbi:hypothetical protein BD414DRAFT_424584 [Trametes punicea]|nr:hypothetical protein BD414DRAFT_424584 [Trametes punicea]
MSSPLKSAQPVVPRSNAPPLSGGPPPAHAPSPLPLPRPDQPDDFPPSWANAVTRFSTLSGALSLSLRELKALKKVPREACTEESTASARITRTRSMIMLGQRIDFAFQTGPRHMKGKGMPVYALANASQAELLKHMALGSDKVMEPFGLRRVRIRIQWPYPRDHEVSHISFEEWTNVDLSMTRVQLAMSVAQVFRTFFEKHRVLLATLPDYTWLLRPDAFHRVWVLGLERTENNVFEADLRYVKDYPSPQP